MSITQLQNIPLQDVIASLAVLVGMVLSVGAVRTALRKLGSKANWKHLGSLADSLSNLIYIVGLKLFGDVAPLHPKALVWLDHFIYLLGVLILISLLRRSALIVLESSSENTGFQGFAPLIRNAISAFIYTMGGIMILKHFNYDVMSLLTALGVGSLAVGLAAKETLSNMISGFTLIIDNNLKPKDRVNLNGVVGTVEEIGLRSTSIRTGDGNLLIVPNAELVNTKILNLSLPGPEGTCSSLIRVSTDHDFKLIEALCMRTLTAVDGVRINSSTHTPWIHLQSLAEGHQLIQIGFWIEDGATSGTVLSKFHQTLLTALKDKGIQLLSVSPSNSL